MLFSMLNVFTLLLKSSHPIPWTLHLVHFGPAMSDLGSSLSVCRLLSFASDVLGSGPSRISALSRGICEFQRKPISYSLCNPPCLFSVHRVASEVVLSSKETGQRDFLPYYWCRGNS